MSDPLCFVPGLGDSAGECCPNTVMDAVTTTSFAAPSQAGAARIPSLLDAVLAASHNTRPVSELDEFVAESSPWKALAWWLTQSGVRDPMPTRQQVQRLLVRDLARLDGLIGRQVNAILHHPALQALEASWRGLRYLAERAAEAENVKVRVLHLTWRELARDLERALEFDQSQLFRKVYSEEFGTPGGEPFGLLLGDYAVRPRPSADHPTDDVSVLAGAAAVAAAAFAPLVVAAHPSLFDLASFVELERPLELGVTFTRPDAVKWRALRDADDGRFVGLALPRVLLRLPYGERGPPRADGFPFREEAGEPDRRQCLWGNPAYAFGAVVVQAFADAGWFAELRGVPAAGRGQGLVAGLPVPDFATDAAGVAPKCSVEVMLTEFQEKELAELGFVPVCHCPGTDLTALFSNMSLQRPRTFDEEAGTVNARLSAMLQYVLCVSRFAHYLKVMARDKVGGYSDPTSLENHLQRWLLSYTVAHAESDPETRAKYPLREARVEVREAPGKPGSFQCVMHLRPHAQLDQVLASIRLVTELSPGRRR